MSLHSECRMRSEHCANVALAASVTLHRHHAQRANARQLRKPSGFVPIVTLTLASIIGALLSFNI